MSVRSAQAIRFKGRSYFSLTISPELPLAAWLERLDGWLERSPGFFSRNSVILDVRDLGLDKSALTGLLADLKGRAIRVLGIDGGDPAWAGADMPPFMPSGKDVRTPESEPETHPSSASASAAQPAGIAPAASGWAAPLYIDSPVRSGQSVLHPDGDVIITGSVASGAEVVAAGSIHIYGALRGRAMAGAYGDESARIFCRSLEAELIAVNGLYQTADEIDDALRKKPAQVRLKHGTMQVSKFD
ncbi:MAG: septum site-determining protein MinC [Beijerinckiaceae bacterium]|nr:septum site-determining protein MinC [Beijerinckiaceae bacterium]